jgi:hypothetical protein
MSDLPIPRTPPSIEALLDLAAGVDFLIRSRHQPQAALAADELARWLLYHYRELVRSRVMSVDEAGALARKAIIAIVEAKSVAARARAGRAPHISRLRSLVLDLQSAETISSGG